MHSDAEGTSPAGRAVWRLFDHAAPARARVRGPCHEVARARARGERCFGRAPAGGIVRDEQCGWGPRARRGGKVRVSGHSRAPDRVDTGMNGVLRARKAFDKRLGDRSRGRRPLASYPVANPRDLSLLNPWKGAKRRAWGASSTRRASMPRKEKKPGQWIVVCHSSSTFNIGGCHEWRYPLAGQRGRVQALLGVAPGPDFEAGTGATAAGASGMISWA